MDNNKPKSQRPVLGRTLSESPFASMKPGTIGEKEQRFLLGSGRRVNFVNEIIPADEIESRTFVDEFINGREQGGLNKHSLDAIIKTLPNQQFFPAIGRLIDDRIEILDGSRRRAAALFCGVDLKVMYTKSDITAEEARGLASDIQTAKEHTIREIGMQYLAMRESGMSQNEIAKKVNVSSAKVSRAIFAASIPAEMLAPFQDRSELSHTDYKKLYQLAELANKHGILLDELSDRVCARAQELYSSDIGMDIEIKDEILQTFDAYVNEGRPIKVNTDNKTEVLKTYEDSRSFAKKKTNTKSQKVVYELSRLPAEAQREIDEAVQNILNKY